MIVSKSAQATLAYFACLVLVALLGAPAAKGGALYFDLVIDPVTTAFSGIPAAHGFGGTSNRSGAGTWHLYAIDDIDNSFGISSYLVKLNPGAGGAIPAISNRSPNTAWFDIDDELYAAGFAGLRSGPNLNPITGAQGFSASNTPLIGGFGISASDFQLKVTGAESFAATTNGQWGKYADYGGGSVTLQPSGHVRNPLFLAEGTYTGLAPTVDIATPASSGGTAAQYFTNANLTSTASATEFGVHPTCPLCGVIVGNENFPNVNANNPGFIERTITGTVILPSGFSPLGPGSWTGFEFDSFVPPSGGVFSTSPGQAATFDPATSKFHWITVGAPLGTYQWHVTATVQGYTGLGFITAHITTVPEPATLSLIAVVTVAGVALLRRRHA